MGITIHYQGKIKSPQLLPQLIEEVRDIAEENKWKYHIFESELPEEGFDKDSFEDELYGITFTPPECEMVDFTFLSSGKLCSVVGKIYFEDEQNDIFIEWNSVKTQYAGPQIHIILVHLLEHIATKYLTDFKVIDEGEYWETRDEKLLGKKFDFLTGILRSMESNLEMIPKKPDEDLVEYIKRIMENVHKNKD
ncbi:hypothetical protein [Aquiflexum sp.]|uniref:hypothetical protein n=1 Tax=Aquiflexum sp. TaxID=1872584 RepID=UPI003593D50C